MKVREAKPNPPASSALSFGEGGITPLAEDLDSHLKSPTFFGRHRWVAILAVICLMLGGLALRLLEFSQPPLDVHAWRQLRSALMARGMYYDMLPSADPGMREQAHYLAAVLSSSEPPIFERLVATTYLAVGEHLWVPRAYSVLFWMLGAVALFLLARRLTSIDGGLVALAFYLFLPFANTHSRVFMPEPIFICLMLWALLSADIWVEKGTWKWAVLTGLFAGSSIFVKVFAVYPLVPGIGLLLLYAWGLKRMIRSPQFWTAIGLMALIPAAFYVIGNPGAAGGYLSTWSLPFLHMLRDPFFYIGWAHRLHALFNLVFLVLALVSLPLLPRRGRALGVGLWIGYVFLGLSVPSLIRSHIYYNLPLVPIVALCLAPLGALVLGKLSQQGRGWQALVVVVALAGLIDAGIWARKEIHDVDYSQEPAYWQELAQQLPDDGNYVGITEDYNGRMMYYGWRYVQFYPTADDLDMSQLAGSSVDRSAIDWPLFLERTEGYDYFLVTLLDEFEKQPYLKEVLYGYYPVVMESERMVLFDLRTSLQPLPVGN